MASIEKRASKAGGVRYVARFRVNGRTDERWFSTLAAARTYKTRIEAEAQDGADRSSGWSAEPRSLLQRLGG